jgi:hypothetical protein
MVKRASFSSPHPYLIPMVPSSNASPGSHIPQSTRTDSTQLSPSCPRIRRVAHLNFTLCRSNFFARLGRYIVHPAGFYQFSGHVLRPDQEISTRPPAGLAADSIYFFGYMHFPCWAAASKTASSIRLSGRVLSTVHANFHATSVGSRATSTQGSLALGTSYALCDVRCNVEEWS